MEWLMSYDALFYLVLAVVLSTNRRGRFVVFLICGIASVIAIFVFASINAFGFMALFFCAAWFCLKMLLIIDD